MVVAQLKTGSAEMIVTRIEKFGELTAVYCVWSDKDHQLSARRFRPMFWSPQSQINAGAPARQQRAQPRPRDAAELGPRREFKACRHKCRGGRCPFSVVKRTLQECAAMSASDPTAT
jgi:hypothetical protein